jgi:hypothetical protein
LNFNDQEKEDSQKGQKSFYHSSQTTQIQNDQVQEKEVETGRRDQVNALPLSNPNLNYWMWSRKHLLQAGS